MKADFSFSPGPSRTPVMSMRQLYQLRFREDVAPPTVNKKRNLIQGTIISEEGRALDYNAFTTMPWISGYGPGPVRLFVQLSDDFKNQKSEFIYNFEERIASIELKNYDLPSRSLNKPYTSTLANIVQPLTDSLPNPEEIEGTNSPLLHPYYRATLEVLDLLKQKYQIE